MVRMFWSFLFKPFDKNNIIQEGKLNFSFESDLQTCKEEKDACIAYHEKQGEISQIDFYYDPIEDA